MPEGFLIDDAEQDDHLLMPGAETAGAQPADPHAALIDATKPGAHLPEPIAKYVVGETYAAERKARAEARKRAGAKPAAPEPFVDPATTYAGDGHGQRQQHQARHGQLGHADRAAGSRRRGAAARLGEQVDAHRDRRHRRRFSSASCPDRGLTRAVPRPGAASAAGDHHLVATLASAPSVQGALIAIDPSTGELVSMVGGYDYAQSQFNRARQAHRQIGSAMKPFIYASAIDRGMTELTIKYDAPVKFKTASGVWAPHNYKHEFLGPLTLRTAIAKSVNTVSAQLVAQMGVDAVIDTMRRLGIRSALPHSLSLALGTADLTLEEVAYGLATFPAGGEEVKPIMIRRLLDADGRVLEDHTAPVPRARKISPETAYIVTDLMKGVVEIGTGKKARELGRPAAGKTGTSTNYRDAWFFGFTPDLLCGVWIGRDDFKPIAHDATGGQVALPVWLSFMRQALQGTAGPGFPAAAGDCFRARRPGKGAARAAVEGGEPANAFQTRYASAILQERRLWSPILG